jgi:HemY protein
MITKPVRWVLWIFGMALVAVLLALAGRYGAGYVIFVIPPWRIDLSVLMFVLLLTVCMLLTYAAIRVAQRAWALPRQLRQQKVARERERVISDLHSGMKALFSGRFNEAEHLARRVMAADHVAEEDRHLAAALAAWSAHEGGNLPAALPYLEKIGERDAAMRDASRAYMLLAYGRADEALPLLQARAAAEPANIGVLKMKVEAEMAAATWPAVSNTLVALRRTGLLPAAAAAEIALKAEIELTKSRAATRDALLEPWKKLDAATRIDPRLATVLVERLLAATLYNDAATVIEESLAALDAARWTAATPLLSQYATARTDSTINQIERAEAWLAQQPRNAVLLATLGKLCMRQALWGKAQSYLEASVALQPTLDAHMTLAKLMEQIGKPADAMQHIRRSAELANAA